MEDFDGEELHRAQKRRLLVQELNPCIICSLCDGYLIDATAINECLHTFCRSCIVRYLESSRYCPTCEILIHKNKPLSALRADKSLQLLVYKLVPSVYQNEVKRRTEFYSNARASSSCSDDSILTDSDTPERSVLHHIHDDSVDFFSPDDSISLSLEYYNGYNNNENEKMQDKTVIGLNENSDPKLHQTSGLIAYNPYLVAHKRYLQCPAGVNVKHLTKFIRMKYGLSFQHRIDIIYEDEVLPKYFTLMDVAYSFKWKRTSPMRFMYRIFESTKTPILKFKQEPSKLEPLPTNFNETPRSKTGPTENFTAQTNTTHNQKSQSNKTVSSNTESIVPIRSHKPKTLELENSSDQQRDEEARLREKEREIQEFAKKRDLEWANLMRQSRSPTPPPASPKPIDRVSFSSGKSRTKDKPASPKKRKKSKHSKHSTSPSKRRKLHAEIQSPTNEQDDILKLKVKLTPTVHKVHKHKHSLESKASTTNTSKVPPPEKVSVEPPVKDTLSTKEKLLQMRQVRHKPISSSTNQPDSINCQAKKVRFEISKPAPEKLEKTLEVKLNKCPQLVAPNSFTVEKVASGDKRKAESFELTGKPDPKVPSLEIMLINPTKAPDKTESINRNTQNLVGNKNFPLKINNNNNTTNNFNANSRLMAQNKMIMMRNLNLIQKTNPVKVQNGVGNGPTNQPKTLINTPKSSPVLNSSANGTKNQILSPIKKSVPPAPASSPSRTSTGQSASTIPLSKIKKAGTKYSQAQKSSPKTDNFGALDLSEKSTRISPNRLEVSSDLKSTTETTKPNETPTKSLTNLHLLSESAVHLRDRLISAQNNNMGKTESKQSTGSNHPKPQSNGISLSESKTISTPEKPKIISSEKLSPVPSKPLPNLTKPGTPSPKQNGQITPKVSDKLKLDSYLNSNPNSPQSKLNKILSTRLNFQPATSPNLIPSTMASLMKSISPINSQSTPTSTNPGSQTLTSSSSPPLLTPTSSSNSPLPTIRIPILQNSKSLQAQMRSLQTMPKLQELSKISHFNTQIRATPNQAVRNIPNPSVVLARHAAVQNKPSTLLEAKSTTSSLVESTPKLIAESASS